jgi:hypothetical protein
MPARCSQQFAASLLSIALPFLILPLGIIVILVADGKLSARVHRLSE